MSRLDYGNALLAGITDKDTRRLQLAQNTLARVVTYTPRWAHITPILRQLHWLPVELRIEFKVLSLVYKCLHYEQAPEYLRNLLQLQIPPRQLRSASDKSLLAFVRTNKATGDKAFGVCASKLWNRLTKDIREKDSFPAFKRSVKTLLFQIHFQ